MAHRDMKEKVFKMRKEGMSYSQIRQSVQVSKSTLSIWLRDLPLTEERILELRGNSAQRIEKYRNTMSLKRQSRFNRMYEKSSLDIGTLNLREVFIAGLYLYWGEGTKTSEAVTALTNTNPAMIEFFICWFKAMGIDSRALKFKLQLYVDMDVESEISFWSNALKIPRKQFTKASIKKSTQTSKTYRTGFSHGTCTIIYHGIDFNVYIKSALKYMQNQSGGLYSSTN